MKETIITWTTLKEAEYAKAMESDKFGELVELEGPISKKDKPELGLYILEMDGGEARVYTVREVDVQAEIDKLTDEQKTKHLEDGFRVKGLHAPAHAKVKADLGIVKSSGRAEREKVVREETLKGVIDNLVKTGMSLEEARGLILPTA